MPAKTKQKPVTTFVKEAIQNAINITGLFPNEIEPEWVYAYNDKRAAGRRVKLCCVFKAPTANMPKEQLRDIEHAVSAAVGEIFKVQYPKEYAGATGYYNSIYLRLWSDDEIVVNGYMNLEGTF